MLSRLKLRTQLTLPYVVLVLVLALLLGVLSYRAGKSAVDNLSGQLLVETVNRIGQAVDRHVAGSAAVLESAFPRGLPAPRSLQDDMTALRTRFWLATSVHRDPNNYAYYGDRHGRFFGLWRFSETEAELRFRPEGSGPRAIYRFSGIAGALGTPAVEERIFDPRERPWYRAAQASAAPTWTSVYIDFKTTELVATRTRRVNNAAGEFEGVVATDLSLQQVNAFLQRLKLSANGVALVVEADGNIIGVSRGPHLSAREGKNTRLNAADSADPMVVAAYQAVRSELADTVTGQPRTTVFRGPGGELVQMGFARLRDDAGLDWQIMVAVPRHDFLHQIEANFISTGLLATLAAVAVALIGLAVLRNVTQELRKLSEAARLVGEGHPADQVLGTDRADELGDLARTFAVMQSRLLTDPLTGLANREAVMRRIEERIVQQRRRGDARPFVVMFVDLNRFKAINDELGHDMGDVVLRELATRLRNGVRANDTVARYAGDEFVILLESVDKRRDALAVREHLDAALREPIAALAGHDQGQLLAGAAFGLAIYPDDGQDVQTLIKHADEDMYRHKSGA
jgi:diguanylate cyclase (GGDEF)-like protein